MTTLREQGVFDLTPGRVFTDDEVALIEERRAYLRLMHKEQQRMCGSDVITPWASSGILGGVMWLREMGFAKIAILNRGAALIDKWFDIKRERDIPVQVLAWEVGDIEIARGALDWESNLYRHIEASVQDRQTLELNEGFWVFRPIPDLPGFSTIPTPEAMFFYRSVGGDIPHFFHIQVTPPYRGVTMVGGGTHTVQFMSDGGELPITWSVAGPEWMTIDATGLVTLAPPELAPGTVGEKDVYAAITAKGRQDVEGHASLNVIILPIRD